MTTLHISKLSLIAPLTWYQDIMTQKTITTFPESELLMFKTLQELNVNFDPTISLYENLYAAGSVGYNYIIDNIVMTRVGLSLENHGIMEKYAILCIEGDQIVNISRQYSNSKQKIEIVKRHIQPQNNCYIFSTCTCYTQPKAIKKLNCSNCVNMWKCQHHSFYPELLKFNYKLLSCNVNLLM